MFSIFFFNGKEFVQLILCRCAPICTPRIRITSLTSFCKINHFCHILCCKLRTTGPQLHPLLIYLYTIDCSICLTCCLASVRV